MPSCDTPSNWEKKNKVFSRADHSFNGSNSPSEVEIDLPIAYCGMLPHLSDRLFFHFISLHTTLREIDSDTRLLHCQAFSCCSGDSADASFLLQKKYIYNK